jgi:hypothetical protein
VEDNVMFVSLVEPVEGGQNIETLAVLINVTPDGERGSLLVLFPNGNQSVQHNVPFDGYQFAGGRYVNGTPPANLVPPTTPIEEPPPEEPPAEETETSSYSVGS